MQEYFYDVYGKCWNAKKDPVNPRQYVGGYGVSADADDGLLYMRARYQDPGLGVFISRDPIGLRGGLNLYGYVNNNPVNSFDFSGFIPWNSRYYECMEGVTILLHYYALVRSGVNDKWCHCSAFCEYAKRCGFVEAFMMGIAREATDQVHSWVGSKKVGWEWSDIEANNYGIGCSFGTVDCEKCCSQKYSKKATGMNE